MNHPMFLGTTAIMLSLTIGCTNKMDQATSPASIQAVPFNQVKIDDHFWLPKIETNRTVTIPASFALCEANGRIENFLIAGGVMQGKTRGKMPFDDTDVYKVIEGASYSLQTIPDPKLDAYLDSVIAIIKIGQEKDGYLTTWKTIDPKTSPAPSWCPPGERWENLAWSHELYNSGHMFEAAAAHHLATGKTDFLDIATKNADLLVSVFGPGKNPDVPGHQIVETGLIKLYKITKNESYLQLARHFLDQRGDSTKRKIWGAYNQDHKPVVEQDEAVGHAVRALYMYAGMADVALLQNDSAYIKAVDNLWDNVVTKKFYITGALGARHDGEAFGDNYELPNLTAYGETCAAIANVYWNYRMFLLHGHAKYIDVLERSLYNGVISGVSLDGKAFFYPNPLECDLHYKFNSHGTLDRQPWFDCSCCPTNICRFLPSVPGYIYAQRGNDLYVNLFVQSSTSVKTANGQYISIDQKTQYPWSGNVVIGITPQNTARFALYVRIPGWADNKPVPGDLYRYTEPNNNQAKLSVNGQSTDFAIQNGYAVIEREWKKGDQVVLELPMEVKRVACNPLVIENKGKTSLERGPIVYCVEGIDNGNDLSKLVLPDSSPLSVSTNDTILGVPAVTWFATKQGKNTPYTAIPYYVWNNRGIQPMKVWLPRE